MDDHLMCWWMWVAAVVAAIVALMSYVVVNADEIHRVKREHCHVADVSRPRAPTPLDVERIRQHLPTPRDRVLMSVLAYAGLRPEVAPPLRWSDLGRAIAVSRTFTHGELRERTKTGRIRSVEIVAPLAADLGALRPRVHGVNEMVFPSPTGLMLDWGNRRRRVWDPATKAAGAQAVPYDLRHTFVSLLIHEGRSVPYVAAMSGHSPRVCLERYAHLFGGAELDTAQSMVEAIEATRAQLDVRRMYPVSVLRALA